MLKHAKLLLRHRDPKVEMSSSLKVSSGHFYSSTSSKSLELSSSLWLVWILLLSALQVVKHTKRSRPKRMSKKRKMPCKSIDKAGSLYSCAVLGSLFTTPQTEDLVPKSLSCVSDWLLDSTWLMKSPRMTPQVASLSSGCTYSSILGSLLSCN
jgi:hypothetical protein